MTPADPLRVGIVGHGAATTVFHAPLIDAVPGLSLVAVASRDAAKVLALRPALAVCATPAELFARADIDLVVIPTPNDTHHPLALQALAAGKHVVVDKPFTLDAAQARELIDAAARARRVLSVFQNRRWDGDFRSLRQLVADGTLGRITHLESQFNRFRPQVPERWREAGGPGSGLWYDLGPHLVDQALQLFGMPQSITLDLQAQRDGAVVDDWFHAVLRYERLRVVLHASALAADTAPRFLVHGTRGSWRQHGLDAQEDALKRGEVPGGAGWGASLQPSVLTVPDAPAATAPTLPGDYTRYYAALRDAVRGEGPNPVPAEDGLAVMRVLDAGRQSAAEGRAVVP